MIKVFPYSYISFTNNNEIINLLNNSIPYNKISQKNFENVKDEERVFFIIFF